MLFLDGDEQFEVNSVLDVRVEHDRKREFLVKWLSYGPEHKTWEPKVFEHLAKSSEYLQHVGSDMLQAFWDSQPFNAHVRGLRQQAARCGIEGAIKFSWPVVA